MSSAEAQVLQRQFATEGRGLARGVVVVLRYPESTLQEKAIVEEKAPFLYVLGLLSFWQLPLVLAAFERISSKPDLLLVDGYGVAHLGVLALPQIWIAFGHAEHRLCQVDSG